MFPPRSLPRRLAGIAGTLLIAGGSWPAGAAQPQRGMLLYENHCTECHTSVVHVRERKKARTRAELRTWIVRWTREKGLPWSAEEVDDVAAFLAARYYGFSGAD